MVAECDGSGLLSVAVVDNGRGLSPEGLDRLFKPCAPGQAARLPSCHRNTG